MHNSFGAKRQLSVAGRTYVMFQVGAVPGSARLPFALQILLENLLRHEDGVTVTRADIEAVAHWTPSAEPEREIAFRPARVLLQDFTGVPAAVDLAAMREAMRALGGDPRKINPLQPAELVIDHSVQVDHHGSEAALALNTELEFRRNQERYRFLKWTQQAFANFRVAPPGTGIVHQINLEYLARVVFEEPAGGGDAPALAYPDTLVGTDSHTTMINGLGVLGWGVGGIEAEAALLGQPITLLLPQVVGVRLVGRLPAGTTATDLALTLTERLRQHNVVGKFVEFHGPALAHLTLGDRATVANMAPEYGATCALFPCDGETLEFLRLTGRPPERLALIEAYLRAQGWLESRAERMYSTVIDFDLDTVEPSLAGPRRPQDRIPVQHMKRAVTATLHELRGAATTHTATATLADQTVTLSDGAVAIAAITSCTNTSNPYLLLAAGILARKAVARGLRVPPWVKTSLAPGSTVAARQLAAVGLLAPLQQLGFYIVGYGCTTCIGNSGPLHPEVSRAIAAGELALAAVLSGNRNFEGRIHPEVRLNYLASPPLVVAYALAGRVTWDPVTEPLGNDAAGQPVYLHELWPTADELAQATGQCLSSADFAQGYAAALAGDARWQALAAPSGAEFAWDPDSTYIRRPPYFDGMTVTPEPPPPLTGARCLVWLGDSVTTDHISPAGNIKPDSPAGRYLRAHGVMPAEFNAYGARRGNHEVMVRGTFAHSRLKNYLAGGPEGGVTRHLPSGELLAIYDAALRYQAEGVPMIVLAGKDYGSGSSRDWAAKGPRLLGVRAVLAESYERIHRTNLVCMGIMPLQFQPGENAATLGLTGEEIYDFAPMTAERTVAVTATAPGGRMVRFTTRARLDTPTEAEYYRHGGILHYVLRKLAAA